LKEAGFMTAVFKATAITLAATVWLAPPTDSGSAAAGKRVLASPCCGDGAPGRRMINIRYAARAVDLAAAPDDALF
jgi:hypothetical protein